MLSRCTGVLSTVHCTARDICLGTYIRSIPDSGLHPLQLILLETFTCELFFSCISHAPVLMSPLSKHRCKLSSLHGYSRTEGLLPSSAPRALEGRPCLIPLAPGLRSELKLSLHNARQGGRYARERPFPDASVKPSLGAGALGVKENLSMALSVDSFVCSVPPLWQY